MSDVTYVTDGPWGTGTGAPHTANSADTNFWILYSLIVALQDATPDTIAYFTVTGSNMWITMTDHYVFGPFTIPTAVWNFRGVWGATNSYAVNDVFTADGAVYLVIWPQTNSGASFYAQANDGQGHNYYALLLAAPPAELPDDGVPGQVLQWTALEIVCRYQFVESTQFPVGLTGSQGSAGAWGTGEQAYELYQNGANIGSINFNESPTDTATFTFPSAITFHAGDVLTIVAPSVPDPHLTHINFTLVGEVVLP